MQGHGLFGPAGPVLHLDRQAQALAHPAEALDPFGATLTEHLAMAAQHHLGVEAAGARHQLRMGQHRPAEPFQVGLLGGPQVGKQQGHLGQLQLQGRRAAVIAGRHQFGAGHAEQVAHLLEHLLLQGMVRLQVALQGPVHAAATGQEGGVLARAVVLQGTGAAHRDRALQLLRFQVGVPEQLEGFAGVGGGAGMGGTGNRQAAVIVAGLVGGAAGHEHLGLEGFEG